MTDKESVRRRLVGGGVVSMAMAAVLVLVVGAPATLAEALPFAWLAGGGLALFAAGWRERLSLGVATVGWPRVAALGLAILAAGSSTIGFGLLLTGSGALSVLQGLLGLFVALLLAFGALECLLGGVAIDEHAFVVE